MEQELQFAVVDSVKESPVEKIKYAINSALDLGVNESEIRGITISEPRSAGNISWQNVEVLVE